MRRGFTVVWSGWQGDVPPGADRLTARFPIIPGITGMVREEFIAENTGLLGDSNIQELSDSPWPCAECVAFFSNYRRKPVDEIRGDVHGASNKGRDDAFRERNLVFDR